MAEIRRKKTLCFDLDGTLCTAVGRDYSAAEPFPWAIERVNALARAGHEIIIMTARGAATGIDWSDVTRDQLERWGVTYHELRFGKPRADVFIDDRGIHTDAWRADDAFGLPGYDRGGALRKLPTTVAGHVTSIVESGRTFAGRALRLDAHVDRARTVAMAAGVRGVPAAAELRQAVERVLPGEDEDVVFTIRLSDLGTAAHMDLLDGALAPRAYVSCRPVRQALGGAGPWVADDGGPPAVAASMHPGATSAWPLYADADERVEDLLGGELAIVTGSTLAISTALPVPGVASRWLSDLAAAARFDVVHQPVTLDAILAADETFVVGFPFCLASVTSLDGRALGNPARPVARQLLDAWSSDAATDLGALSTSRADLTDPASAS